MSTIGKSVIAVALLALMLGLGWWGLDGERQEHAMSEPSAASAVISQQLPDSEWVAEMHASVRLLSETLAATGNVGGALALIDVLDARAARQPASARLTELRSAFAADRQKLASFKAFDMAAASATLERLIAGVDALPLMSSPQPMLSKPTKAPAESNTPATFTVDAVMQAIRARFADVVRIRKVEHPEAMFLTPEQGALVAERLRLRLLSARLALVSRQEALFAQDIGMAESILSKAFDVQDPAVMQAKASISSLKAMAGRLAVPTQLQSMLVIERLKNETAARP